MPTDPPFTTKRPGPERVPLIREALGSRGWVLSGSFDGWGHPLAASVDLIVFVVTPTSVRMVRLMSISATAPMSGYREVSAASSTSRAATAGSRPYGDSLLASGAAAAKKKVFRILLYADEL